VYDTYGHAGLSSAAGGTISTARFFRISTTFLETFSLRGHFGWRGARGPFAQPARRGFAVLTYADFLRRVQQASLPDKSSAARILRRVPKARRESGHGRDCLPERALGADSLRISRDSSRLRALALRAQGAGQISGTLPESVGRAGLRQKKQSSYAFPGRGYRHERCAFRAKAKLA